jgi:transglutaminase-like putative cysteine protease
MSAIRTFIRKRISLTLVVFLALIYLIMYSVLLGIELVIRGTSVEVLHLMIILGIIFGWLLGRSQLKNWVAGLISLLAGFTLTSIHIGGIDTALWDLIKSSLGILWRWIFSGVAVDLTQLSFILSVIQTRIQDLIINLAIWENDILTGFYIYNQVSTLLTWGFLLWLLASWLAWITRNKDLPIWGVIPAGTLLAILMTYTLEKRILLVLLLGAGFILIGLINHEVNQRDWKLKRVKGAENVKERLALVIVAFSLCTMAFAGLVPSIKIKAISDPFERWIYGDSSSGEVGSDSAVEIGGFNSDLYSVERFTGMPRQKLIGSGPELAKRVVMIVKYPTTSFVKSDLPNAARYWRSYSYDQYTGIGWQSSPTVEVEYKPGQEIIKIQTDNFEVITQEIRLSNALKGTLYSAGPPITLDQDVLVSWRTIQEVTLNGNSQTVVVDDLFGIRNDHILYQVRSVVPTSNEKELRQAVIEIPEWISSRYLVLPETVPDRVLDLAQEIITNQPTAYDQVKAIETFLRSYPYTLDIPAPPIDRDVVDYFLFDLQAGYCDYYATSMVVLARAIGLPARIVVGYVGGQFEEENNQYLVTEADAHTWVEVYFGGHGWIPFEPTAAQSLISDEQLSLPLPPELEQPPQILDNRGKTEFPGWEIGIGVLVFIIVGIWIGYRVDWTRLKKMDATSLSLAIYQRLFLYGRWLGLGHEKTDTLYEFDQKMKVLLRQLANTPGKEKRLIGSEFEISQLTEYAVLANYSIDSVDPEQAERILEVWRKLRRKLRNAIWLSTRKSLREKVFNLGAKTIKDDLITNGAVDG